MNENEVPPGGIRLTSPAFNEGGIIPIQYTSKGDNVNPPFNILNTPASTESLVLMMHDPDAVSGDFLHWVVWDIPPSTEAIAANSVPVGAIQGFNGSDELGYMGPAPPPGTGTHRYMFELYALNTTLDMDAHATREEVESAMSGRILDQITLTGLFSAEST